jgi:hypothetical protein
MSFPFSENDESAWQWEPEPSLAGFQYIPTFTDLRAPPLSYGASACNWPPFPVASGRPSPLVGELAGEYSQLPPQPHMMEAPQPEAPAKRALQVISPPPNPTVVLTLLI